MNFYSSPDYLEAVAEVYFGAKDTRVEDVRIGDEVLRLLVVDRQKVITSLPFLDYHEPLRKSEIHESAYEYSHAKFVVRRIIELSRPGSDSFEEFEIAPYVDWTKFATYADYRAFILNRQRGLIRENERRLRRLTDDFGGLEFNMNDTGDDVLELSRQWKSRQLRETGREDYFSDAKNLEFFESLRRRGLLVSSTLRVSGRLVSSWIGFIYDGVWSGWVFAFDAEFRKYSVGHQLLSFMLQKSYELRHKEFDFSIGGESYKFLYATHGRLLGPIGRVPLTDRLVQLAKHETKRRNPRLFEMARNLKRAL
jgi:CelD/BcsL family acetyltransferase involved in cellulose biosynthesis